MDESVAASSRARRSSDRRLTTALIALAHSLASDHRLSDLLDTLLAASVELLGADEGGLLIREPPGSRLRSVVSTGADSRRVEEGQLRSGRGPSIASVDEGQPVSVADIETDAERWPEFRDSSLVKGFRSVHCFPLRRGGVTWGSMNLFGRVPRALDAPEVEAWQALTDVATIFIMQQRSLEDSARLTHQLQQALDSRVVIEQAKGVVAQSEGISLDDAFAVLRARARNSRRPLGEIAAEVVRRTADPGSAGS